LFQLKKISNFLKPIQVLNRWFSADFLVQWPVHAHTGFTADLDRMQVWFPVRSVRPAGPVLTALIQTIFD
jgi:hypothetical protein